MLVGPPRRERAVVRGSRPEGEHLDTRRPAPGDDHRVAALASRRLSEPDMAACGRLVASRIRRQVVHTDLAGQRRRLRTAAEAIAAFDRHWTAVADSVIGFADADLLEAVGAVGGRFGGGSIHGLVLHVADELIHHAAEIGVLRDLHRAGLR